MQKEFIEAKGSYVQLDLKRKEQKHQSPEISSILISLVSSFSLHTERGFYFSSVRKQAATEMPLSLHSALGNNHSPSFKSLRHGRTWSVIIARTLAGPTQRGQGAWPPQGAFISLCHASRILVSQEWGSESPFQLLRQSQCTDQCDKHRLRPSEGLRPSEPAGPGTLLSNADSSRNNGSES